MYRKNDSKEGKILTILTDDQSVNVYFCCTGPGQGLRV